MQQKMTLLSKSLTDSSGEIPWSDRYGYPLSSEICRSDHEPRRVKDTFIKRSQILKEIRNFLDGRDFMEVETPMLVSNAGGAAARPFETHYNALE